MKKILKLILQTVTVIMLILTDVLGVSAGCGRKKVDESTLVIDVVFPGLSFMKPRDDVANPVAKEIYEKTGIKIKANFYDGMVTQKLTSIVSMGTTSDLIMFRYCGTDDGADKIIKDAISAGFFLPISDWTKNKPNLEPNYTIGLSRNFIDKGIDDSCFGGKRYILPMHTAKDVENEINWGYTVYGRKDILDDLSVDPYSIHTSNEIYELAKRIRDGGYKDINGNEVIPASCWQQGWAYEVYLNSFKYRQMTGILEDDEGNLKWVGFDDKMVEEAKFMQKMIKERLFDAEAFTHSDAVAKEKHINGMVGLTAAHYPHIRNMLEHTLYAKHPEMRYIPIGPIYDANGNPYMPETYSTYGLNATAVFVIPETSRNKMGNIIKYLDFINSEEGRDLVYLGIKDVDWYIDENGEKKVTSAFKENLEENGRYAVDRGIGSIYTYGVARLDNNVYNNVMTEKNDPGVLYEKKVKEMYPLVRKDGIVATFWDNEFPRHDALMEIMISNDYKSMIESCYFANTPDDIDNKVLAYRRAISKDNLMNEYLDFIKERVTEARLEGNNVLF